MTVTVFSREPGDCAICAIAMATGRTYEEVYAAGVSTGAFRPGTDPDAGTEDASAILKALGLKDRGRGDDGDFVQRDRPFWWPAEDFRRDFAWGRRALLTVPGHPAIGMPGRFHLVFYDGRRVFDSNPRLRYERFEELLPEQVWMLEPSA